MLKDWVKRQQAGGLSVRAVQAILALPTSTFYRLRRQPLTPRLARIAELWDALTPEARARLLQGWLDDADLRPKPGGGGNVKPE